MGALVANVLSPVVSGGHAASKLPMDDQLNRNPGKYDGVITHGDPCGWNVDLESSSMERVDLDERDIRYALSGDTHLAYTIFGQGDVDLVWSSPGISNVEMWSEYGALRSMAERLAAFSRFITFDQRGAGLSDPVPPQALPTLEERGDDILAVMNAAGSERAALVAQGHNGPQCMLLAATYPERVSALILYGTYARWLRADDYPAGMPPEVADPFRRWVSEVWGTGRTIDGFLPSASQDETLVREWARVERTGASKAAIDALLGMWMQTDVRDILSSIRVPTLIIHRMDDIQFRVGHGRYLAEHIPGAKYLESPGDAHLWMGEDLNIFPGEIEEFVTGGRAAPPPDRVLATVLFTDIVGSTSMASDLGDRAWRELLDRHDRTVQRQLDKFGGRSFKNTGDGVAAVFDGPARAVTCACAIRDVLRPMGIEIRAGLHTGEVELRGRDVSGMAVHIAARVAQVAQAGEAFVSSTVRDLVIGSGLKFDDHGAHRLKGVPDQWRLLKVVA